MWFPVAAWAEKEVAGWPRVGLRPVTCHAITVLREAATVQAQLDSAGG
jgi:hypothetical protein